MHRVFVVMPLACLVATAWPAAAMAGPPRHEAAQTALGILGFARWPGDPHEIRLCVLGRTTQAWALRKPQPAHRHRVTLREPAGSGLDDIRGCDALYLGRLPPGQWQALLQRIAGRPVLTIGEQRDSCAAGGMFCLDPTQADGPGFDVNLKSLARSGVQVHPGMLQLAADPVRRP